MPAHTTRGPAAPPGSGETGQDRPGWTPGRIAALAAGILLGLVSLALLAGGVVALCADLAHWSDEPAGTSWLASELIGSAVLAAMPAALLILVPLRLAAGAGDRPAE